MEAAKDGGAEARVHAYLNERGLGQRLDRLVALTPDASDRRYFRAVLTGSPSIVLAVYPDAITYKTLPFGGVSSLLRDMNIPVPAVLGHVDALGIVALEDLGDITLQGHLLCAAETERTARYREAVDLIVSIQQRAFAYACFGCVCFDLAFDVEKLTWELNFFVQHFLEGHRRAHLSSAERQALAEEWRAIATELSCEPRVLCHRDFHSRNLMLHDDRLCVIDFQDARMGPNTYDLASLLRDSYVDIGDEERTALVDYFLERTGAGRAAAFWPRFDLMSVQRNLKALGTFGYQATVKRNDSYVPYIGRTLAYVRSPLSLHARFARLRDLLARHLPELR